MLLLLGAGSENHGEVRLLLVAGGVEQGFLGGQGEGGEFGADDVTAVLRDRHLIGAGDVGGGGEFLAGEGVGGGDADSGQRNVAGFDGAANGSSRCDWRSRERLRRGCVLWGRRGGRGLGGCYGHQRRRERHDGEPACELFAEVHKPCCNRLSKCTLI